MSEEIKNGRYVNEEGEISWYKNDKFHREDGPAIEWNNVAKAWYVNGFVHREDGPAMEWANGRKDWYQHGKKHREAGPAVERTNGDKEWWLDGEKYSEEQFNQWLMKKELKAKLHVALKPKSTKKKRKI